jgi:hypothetical protein
MSSRRLAPRRIEVRRLLRSERLRRSCIAKLADQSLPA